MSDWWLIVGAFWFWYLADCLKAGRRPRFLVSRGGGRGPASVSHGAAALASLSPLGWQVCVEDPRVSFSPEGLCNVPAGSAGRPAPVPVHAKAWRWEEVRQLSERGGRIYINGEFFCAATPFTNAAALRALIDGCKSRAPAERAAWLERRVADWFRTERLGRQRRVLAGRTGSLAIWAGFGAGLALAVSVYLLAGGYLPLDERVANRIGRVLPMLGLYLLGLHVCLVVAGWQAHRKLLPKRGEARFSLIFGALLLPPQAYRLRARIGAEYFCQAAHPLAWIAAAGRAADFKYYARQALTDLRWPMTDGLSGDALAQAIGFWMRGRVEREVLRLLAARGVGEAELLAAPRKDGAGSCAYCPRCGSQFTSPEGRCPQGVELKRF